VHRSLGRPERPRTQRRCGLHSPGHVINSRSEIAAHRTLVRRAAKVGPPRPTHEGLRSRSDNCAWCSERQEGPQTVNLTNPRVRACGESRQCGLRPQHLKLVVNVFCGWLLHCKSFLAIFAVVSSVLSSVRPVFVLALPPLALMNSASEVPIGLSTSEGRRHSRSVLALG